MQCLGQGIMITIFQTRLYVNIIKFNCPFYLKELKLPLMCRFLFNCYHHLCVWRTDCLLLVAVWFFCIHSSSSVLLLLLVVTAARIRGSLGLPRAHCPWRVIRAPWVTHITRFLSSVVHCSCPLWSALYRAVSRLSYSSRVTRCCLLALLRDVQIAIHRFHPC